MALPAAPAQAPTIAASYERVSTRDQARRGFSLITQRQTVDEYCREAGLDLPDHLHFRDGVDQDASGADWNLPDLTRMLALAKQREFQVLVVPDYDRFARNMAKALVLESQLATYGVEVRYMNLPFDNSAEGQYMKRNFFSLAQYDRDKRALLTSINRRTKAQEGYYVGNGSAPYGYRYVRERRGSRDVVVRLAVVDQEAGVVRQLFEHARERTISQLLHWLDEQGITPPGQARGVRGAPAGWGLGTVTKLLHNPVYVGRAQWGGMEIAVPPIVDATVFEAVETALAARYRRPAAWASRVPPAGDPFLLRGLLTCGPCSQQGKERVLRIGSEQQKPGVRQSRRYYVCRNKFNSRREHTVPMGEHRCPLPSLRADMLEDYLWERLVAELLDPGRVRAHLDDARARRLEFHQRYQDRAAAAEATLGKEQKRFERIIHRINSFDPEALTDEDREELAAQERDRDETKKTLAALRRKLEDLRAEMDAAPVGLSEAGIAEVTRFIGELQAGAGAVTAAERRQILQLLHIRGQVWPGDEIAVGRKPVRTVNVEWQGELRVSSDPRFQKQSTASKPAARSQAS